MQKIYSLNMLDEIVWDFSSPMLVFLYGDLWAWKTTLSQRIIKQYTWKNYEVGSPTYVYYNKYEDIYHFDLYRVENYEYFVSLWWEEILDNNEWIILVEWPEVLEPYYIPDMKIYIWKTDDPQIRTLKIEKK